MSVNNIIQKLERNLILGPKKKEQHNYKFNVGACSFLASELWQQVSDSFHSGL